MPTSNKPNMQKQAGDDAVQRATGKTWHEWIKTLDRAGCAKMNHKQIVAVVAGERGVGPWWQQMVTVGYEQARGLRDVHQKPGGYSISGNKTIGVPVAKLFAAWKQPARRAAWLDAKSREFTIRKSTPGKSLRITWSDGRTNVDVNLYSKGPAKSSVQVEHSKLAGAKQAAAMKRFWAASLAKLKSALESPARRK